MKIQKRTQPARSPSESCLPAASLQCCQPREIRLPASRHRAIPVLALRAYIVMALAASLLAACIPDPSEWFPTGKAGVIGFRELEEGGFKSGLVAIRLENTGRSIIRASTVSVSLETDARRYYRTVTDSASILPGGIVFTNMEFSYDSPEEKATEGEPRLENFFFE